MWGIIYIYIYNFLNSEISIGKKSSLMRWTYFNLKKKKVFHTVYFFIKLNCSGAFNILYIIVSMLFFFFFSYYKFITSFQLNLKFCFVI